MTKAQKILLGIAGGLGAVAASPFLPAVAIPVLGGMTIKALLGLLAVGAGGAAYRADWLHGPKGE